MEINEFLAAKAAMEAEITVAASAAIDRFRGRTGFSPESVFIYMTDVSILGDTMLGKRHCISHVRASVPLE